MRKPTYALVIEEGRFYIHELNEYQLNRYYAGPFDTSDEALRYLCSTTCAAYAIGLVERIV